MSIYYDTLDLRFFQEKLASDDRKTKVRVRWYEDPVRGRVLPASFLEVKYRLGSRRKKLRVKAQEPAAWFSGTSLESPRLLPIPSRLRSIGLEPPAGLQPLLTVRYHRRRFVEPLSRSRISLDTAISVHRANRRLLPWRKSIPLDTGVLEVKNMMGDLPARLRPLLGTGIRLSSFSKYGACLQMLLSSHPVRS